MKAANQTADFQRSVDNAGTSLNVTSELAVFWAWVYRSPNVRTRTVSTQIVTGLWAAIGSSQLGKVSSGTKAVLTNTNGNTIVNRAAWTASIAFSERPANAETHQNA